MENVASDGSNRRFCEVKRPLKLFNKMTTNKQNNEKS